MRPKSFFSFTGTFTCRCTGILVALVVFAFPVLADEQVQFIRVIDGDTIEVLRGADKEAVRLIGVDTPEASRNEKALRDAERSGSDLATINALGAASTRYLEDLLRQGDRLRLEFDVRKRDKYGRLLAYGYLEDGRMLNEEIIAAGYGNLMTIPPNVKHVERFQTAYRKAREEGRGLWRAETR